MEEFPGGLAVKNLALSLLWCGLDPWPGNFHMPWVQQKRRKYTGVPVVAQWLTNPTNIHEDAGLIPGLDQTPIRPLAWEPPQAVGAEKKIATTATTTKKKKKKKKRNIQKLEFPSWRSG